MTAPTARYRTRIADSRRWDNFPFRPGDIVISTPPKCGTTWTQMICALLIFQTADLPAPLDQLSPWLDQELRSLRSVLADLEAQTHRRFIKTHTPLDGIPWDPQVTYITTVRDPRDVFFSAQDHLANLDFEALNRLREQALREDGVTTPDPLVGPFEDLRPEAEQFLSWVDDATPVSESSLCLASLVHHAATFFCRRSEPNVILLHYGDLTRDLETEMRRLSGQLGIEVAEDTWPQLVHAASFQAMKRRSKQTGPNQSDSVWVDPSRFFRQGRLGEWQTRLTRELLDHYQTRIEALCTPELLTWLQRGGGGT